VRMLAIIVRLRPSLFPAASYYVSPPLDVRRADARTTGTPAQLTASSKHSDSSSMHHTTARAGIYIAIRHAGILPGHPFARSSSHGHSSMTTTSLLYAPCTGWGCTRPSGAYPEACRAAFLSPLRPSNGTCFDGITFERRGGRRRSLRKRWGAA
jgi:hypothetical protein